MPDKDNKPPVLERFGLRMFRRRAERLPPVECDDAVQYLNPRERAALRRIERGTVARAAIAGGLSGLCSAIAEIIAAPLAADGGSTQDLAVYWGIILGVTAVATTFEIGFLYWDALRSVHDMARAAGVDLFGGTQTERSVLVPLARAALELPNPARSVLGIHPYQEISRLRVVIATLLYKAKISLTNFLTKMFIRRLAGRAAVRAWLPLVAVPVTAAWNGIVMWRVLREARLRILGPFAITEYLDAIIGQATVSDSGRENLARAVGITVVRKRHMHPNLLSLLAQTTERLKVTEGQHELSSVQRFLEELPTLPAQEQNMAMQMLSVAIVIDGRRGRREVALLEEALRVCGQSLNYGALKSLYRQFVRGNAFDSDILTSISRDLDTTPPHTAGTESA